MANGTVSLDQLESHLWEAANILRGPVDAADYAVNGLPRAISAWLKSSGQVREALGHLLASKSGRNGKA